MDCWGGGGGGPELGEGVRSIARPNLAGERRRPELARQGRARGKPGVSQGTPRVIPFPRRTPDRA